MDTRGTPIRIRSLLRQVARDPRIELSIASWDDAVPFVEAHIQLTNDHLDDMRALVRHVHAQGIRLAIGHTTSASYYLAALKLFTGVRLVLEMHGLEEEEARAYGDITWLRYRLLKSWHALFYHMCDEIVSCSKSVAAIVGKHNAHSSSLCGGVDTARFKPGVPGGTFLSRDDRVIIGYAGNTRIWQGVDFLIDTFRKLENSGRFRLVLLLSDRKGYDSASFPGVEVYGPVEHEEVPKFLTDCDILVIPRPDTPVTRISFPSKIPEHLAMGKAIIAANTGDANEVIEDGVNGLLYPPGDQLALLERIERCASDLSLRTRLGHEAATRAQDLSWEKLGQRFVDILLKVG